MKWRLIKSFVHHSLLHILFQPPVSHVSLAVRLSKYVLMIVGDIGLPASIWEACCAICAYIPVVVYLHRSAPAIADVKDQLVAICAVYSAALPTRVGIGEASFTAKQASAETQDVDALRLLLVANVRVNTIANLACKDNPTTRHIRYKIRSVGDEQAVEAVTTRSKQLRPSSCGDCIAALAVGAVDLLCKHLINYVGEGEGVGRLGILELHRGAEVAFVPFTGFFNVNL